MHGVEHSFNRAGLHLNEVDVLGVASWRLQQELVPGRATSEGDRFR